MSDSIGSLARTIKAARPMLPAKDFEVSLKFYADLGFQAKSLTDNLAEMTLGACSFLLQDCYVQQWADNLVIHLYVSDVAMWWNHISSLNLETRYGVKTKAPHKQDWGAVVAGIVDPSGVLWRIQETRASSST